MGCVNHFGLRGIIQGHVEGYHELSAKTKLYFATAVAIWEAEFYVKVDDDVHVNLGNNELVKIHIDLPYFVVWLA